MPRGIEGADGGGLREIIEETDIERNLGELENSVFYDWGYRPTDASFEAVGSDNDADAIVANLGRAAVGDRRQMYYVLDAATAIDVNSRALEFGKLPPRYVTMVCTLHSLTVGLGDVVLATDVDGVGASGWTNRPLWVLGIQTVVGSLGSAPVVRLTCVDVDRLVTAAHNPAPEGLVLSDTLTVSLNPPKAASVSETAAHWADSAPLRTLNPLEGAPGTQAVRITDGPISGALV